MKAMSLPIAPAKTDSAPGAPAYVIALGRGVTLRLAAYSVLLLFLSVGVFSALTGIAGFDSTSRNWVTPVLYVVVYFGTLVAHELVHGLFFRIFGGSPRYGAGVLYFMPYFYTTSPGAFPLRRMIIIVLAPLLVLSPLSLVAALLVPALAGYLAVAFIGNTAGAVGDIWLTICLIRFRGLKDVTVVDLPNGQAIYTRDAKADEIAGKLSARDERDPGFVGQWITAASAVFVAGVLAGLVGPFFTDSLLIGPAQFPLIAFTRSSQGFAWTGSLASPLLAGLLFALAARLFSRRKPHGAELQTVQ
ncbi:hypothetical protein ANRL1_00489 [Anaerolineae bacterium]|nr:hypothetical protein ANRL1_00489 [Anaerolineae bacterium]